MCESHPRSQFDVEMYHRGRIEHSVGIHSAQHVSMYRYDQQILGVIGCPRELTIQRRPSAGDYCLWTSHGC